jgi:ubiquinone/menaquinone biosynthesis C-methylase UbiE
MEDTQHLPHSTGIPDANLSPKKITEIYDNLSPVYDIWGLLTEENARRRGVELAQVKEGESVLEVAAGTGLILAKIARLNKTGQITGIDISKGMLKKAEIRLKGTENVELKLASALELPFPDGSFDLLMNAYMFDLLPYQQMPSVMSEFWRVLKPGGRMVLINMTVGEKMGSQIYQQVYNLVPSLIGGCRGVLMSDLVEKIGFELKSREYYQQLLFPSEVILAKRSV